MQNGRRAQRRRLVLGTVEGQRRTGQRGIGAEAQEGWTGCWLAVTQGRDSEQ